MSQIISHIHTNSSEYKTNFAHNKKLADQLHERQKEVAESYAVTKNVRSLGIRFYCTNQG